MFTYLGHTIAGVGYKGKALLPHKPRSPRAQFCR